MLKLVRVSSKRLSFTKNKYFEMFGIIPYWGVLGPARLGLAF